MLMSHEDDKTGILPVPNEYMKTLLPVLATGEHSHDCWAGTALPCKEDFDI
jgi:hypothetical protein